MGSTSMPVQSTPRIGRGVGADPHTHPRQTDDRQTDRQLTHHRSNHPRTRWRTLRALESAGVHLVAVTFVLAVTLPLVWMLLSSFRTTGDLFAAPTTMWPREWTLENYTSLLQTTRFSTYFRNSVLVALGATALSILVGTLTAYSLSRFRFAGFSLYARGILVSYMMPTMLLSLPLYMIVLRLGLINSLSGLILSNLTFILPFAVWLLRAYFNSIPVELEEAALVDGCTRLQALNRVVLPLALPGVLSTSIFAFNHSWSEFLYALILISSESKKTLPLGLSSWMSEDAYQWGMLLASGVLVTVPVLALYVLIQRHLVSGLVAGGVKG